MSFGWSSWNFGSGTPYVYTHTTKDRGAKEEEEKREKRCCELLVVSRLGARDWPFLSLFAVRTGKGKGGQLVV